MSHNNYDNEQFKGSVLNELSKLDTKVRQELDVILADTAHLHLTELAKCESPIESIMLLWLRHYFLMRDQEYKQWDNFPLISIEPQRTVEKGKKKYRVDIALDCLFKGENHSFAIECDGHEFHEKTKEQAARDKQRDRDLQSMGYRALRCTQDCGESNRHL
ncbi:hypothetical protein ABEO98_22600 [Brevibacillus parabrevis]|jgi:Protein of unknown function (DUF559).|uniref:hypothetical protein n=1 Tax=Brevibacillus parabrevis TaxID=54914 RepID=UPI0024907D8F|nr:hypothetical protein [Brevibacillus parabrevis]